MRIRLRVSCYLCHDVTHQAQTAAIHDSSSHGAIQGGYLALRRRDWLLWQLPPGAITQQAPDTALQLHHSSHDAAMCTKVRSWLQRGPMPRQELQKEGGDLAHVLQDLMVQLQLLVVEVQQGDLLLQVGHLLL
jgi:uncharacterized protein YecE (DUF72 family)